MCLGNCTPLCKEYQTVVKKEYGQLKFGPPGFWGDRPVPPSGTELFISNIPEDCTICELLPLFTSKATVYEFRHLVLFSEASRGLAYVRFATVADARRVLLEMNGYHIRPDTGLKVVMSYDNRRLVVAAENIAALKIVCNLLKIWNADFEVIRDLRELISRFWKFLEQGVVTILAGKPKTSFFMVVEFATHRDACNARLAMAKVVQQLNIRLQSEWMKPVAHTSTKMKNTLMSVYKEAYGSA